MNFRAIRITKDNIVEEGLCCTHNLKNQGFQDKKCWMEHHATTTTLLKLAAESGKAEGFIEVVKAEKAWRPVIAPGFLYIHCIAVFTKKMRNQGVGKRLIELAVEEAKNLGCVGICVTTSKGTWMADKSLFEKNGFRQVDQKDRFELMCLPFTDDAPPPKFPDWEKQLQQYQGWHLMYSDQCPWHEKAVKDISAEAKANGIDLIVSQIKSSEEAQKIPTGYGTFTLIHQGKVLADHYISKTRFKNILNKELG